MIDEKLVCDHIGDLINAFVVCFLLSLEDILFIILCLKPETEKGTETWTRKLKLTDPLLY